MTITILDTTKITSSSSALTATYANITGMNKNLSVVGTSSIILFVANVTFDGGADAESDLALFIDNSRVCEGRCFVDDNLDELGMVQLTWWETGLSAGTHDFDVRAKDGGQTGGIIYTGEIRSSQVIEFTGTDAPSILDEVSGLRTSQVGTSAYVDITGMNRTVTITGGSTSLVIVSGTVNFADSTDSSGFLGLEIEGTIVAEGQVYGDAANENQCVSFMFAKKAMTTGSRTFDYRMKNGQGTTNMDVDIDRHMQIVEFTNTPLLNEVIGNRTADTTAGLTFDRVIDMGITRTPISTGSHFLVCSSTTLDSDSADSGAFVSISINETNEAIGSSGIDATSTEPGFVGLVIMKTGLSGSIEFETKFKERPSPFNGIIIATDTDKHLQVIEFTAAPAVLKLVPETENITEGTIAHRGLVRVGEGKRKILGPVST